MTKVKILGGLARRTARWLVQIYYPKIKFDGEGQIPKTGPVLLCGNHPNSLVDPILIGITSGRPVRFMAKAPLFKTPVLGSVMYGLGMIPTYRGSDDKKQVRRNLESLDSSIQFLVEGHAVGIFPEGKSHDAVKLEMVRSGVARIAVKAVEQGAIDLVVVPVGLNYGHKEQFRSSVQVKVGEPLEINSWLKENNEEGRKAIRSLTNEVEKRLKEVVVHLEQPDWEPLLEDLVALVRTDSEEDPLRLRKQMADAMNYFVASDRSRAEEVAGEIKLHRDAVSDCGLTLESLILQSNGIRLFGKCASQILGTLLGLLPAILGLLFHLIPFVMVRFLASRVTPPGRTAVSMYRLLAGLPVYAVWYFAAVLCALWMNVPMLGTAVAVLCLPFLGVIALNYWPQVRHSAPQALCQFLILLRRKVYQNLREHQTCLRSKLNIMAGEYAQRDCKD
jgi:glycerol-3-phosphate O-acyltransferase/dihydroxyacetone phosphate acyltransferase